MDHRSKIFADPQRPRQSRRKPTRRKPARRKPAYGGIIYGLFLGSLYLVAAFLLKPSWFQKPALSTTQGLHLQSIGGPIAPSSPRGAGTTLAQAAPQAVVLTSNSPLRSRPSGGGRISGQGQTGDRGTLIDQHTGDDGNLWYFVQFTGQRRQGWVPANQVTAAGANLPAGGVQPTPRAIPPTNPAQPPVAANPELSSQDVLLYFYEVALGGEWSRGNEVVRRWHEDLRIQVVGTRTSEDSATLRSVVDELNALLQGQVQLQFVERDPNVEIFFAPESQFQQLDAHYRPGNLGFFRARWNYDGINNARILISTTGVTQTERSHIIREELTQSLGLMRDSYRYPDSIFYQGWTDVTHYSDIDRAIIQLLYQDGIRPGMTRDEVAQFLSR